MQGMNKDETSNGKQGKKKTGWNRMGRSKTEKGQAQTKRDTDEIGELLCVCVSQARDYC